MIRRCDECRSDWPDSLTFVLCPRCEGHTSRIDPWPAEVDATVERFRDWLDTVWPEDFRQIR